MTGEFAGMPIEDRPSDMAPADLLLSFLPIIEIRIRHLTPIILPLDGLCRAGRMIMPV